MTFLCLPTTEKFQLKLLDPTDRNISQENSSRVLDKFFLELDPTNTAVSLKTAYKKFF
jgi:hypothetical protein